MSSVENITGMALDRPQNALDRDGRKTPRDFVKVEATARDDGKGAAHYRFAEAIACIR